VHRGELTPGPTAVRVLVLKGAVAEPLDSFVLFGEPQLTAELADQLIDAVFGGWIAVDAPAVASETAAVPVPVTNARAAASSLKISSATSSQS